MFRADLHTHTTCSDGSLTPEQLLHHAKAIGLSGLSITDHDTVAAYAVAIPLAKTLNLQLGTGVEFSSVFQEMSVHVLGYDIDLESPVLNAFCARHQERRLHRNRMILEKLKAHKMLISEAELLSSGLDSIGRPHIAQLMVSKGYVSSIREAFNLYLGDDKPCFQRGEPFSTDETIAIIHQSGGKAFIAHPHLLSPQKKIKKLLELPFDGLECHYAKFAPSDEKKWLKVASSKGWLSSGGSDFHGENKSYIPLGCSWVDETKFHQIFSRNDSPRTV